MKSKNKIIAITVLFISSLFITFCSDDDNSVVYDPDALRVAGKYEAVVFWEPGSLDSGVDILNNGGMFKIELMPTKRISGLLIIPDSIMSSLGSYNTEIKGQFKIIEDTLRFINTNTFLDNPQLFFHFQDSIITSTRIYDPLGIILDFKKTNH